MAIELKQCHWCSKEFHGTKRAMYCSNNCKQRAFQQKLREAKDGYNRAGEKVSNSKPA